MVIQNRLKSQVFNDGYLYICSLRDDGSPDYGSRRIFYCGVRNLSQKRLDAAAQIQTEFALVVHVPIEALKACKKGDVVIRRGVTYRIEQVQAIYTSTPSVAVLSLSVWEMDLGVSEWD